MNPPAIPLAKQIIRALTLDKVREVAQAALKLDSPDAVQTLVRQRVSAANVGNHLCQESDCHIRLKSTSVALGF